MGSHDRAVVDELADLGDGQVAFRTLGETPQRVRELLSLCGAQVPHDRNRITQRFPDKPLSPQPPARDVPSVHSHRVERRAAG